VIAVRPSLGVLLVAVVALLVTATPVRAQEGPPQSGPPESAQSRIDSLRAEGRIGRPSQSGGAPSDTSGGVVGTATDSLVIVFDDEDGDRGTLYGESSVQHEQATLEAYAIELDFDQQELHARGAPGPGEQGRPTFQRGSGSGGSGGGSGMRRSAGSGSGRGPSSMGQSFSGERLSYNLDTQRGRVVAARTTQQEALIQGDAVKMFEDSTLFVSGGTYTTCSLECRPQRDQSASYSLRSSAMKVQGKWVYTGPIQLFLFNIPTPLWLPFGFLPAVQGRRSGPLPPEYGQDERGLYLRDWGWYFALNDYTDLQIEAGIWTQGSYEIRPLFRYRKRYAYNGQLQVTYQRDRRGEEQDPDFVNRQQGQLRWNHQQELSPSASFGGNVNLVTSADFARDNTESFQEAVQQQISSNVRYNKTWANGARSINLNASQQQQLQSGQVRLSFPNVQFSQQSFKPFAQETRIGDERWFEKITTQYNLSVSNNYNFNPRDPNDLRQRGDTTLARRVEDADIAWYEALFDRQKYQLATGDDDPFDFQADHRIPLRASFRLERFNANLSPNVDYTSRWVASTVRKRLVRDTTENGSESLSVEEFSVPGFYARHDFNTSLSVSNTVFGTFPVAAGPFEGLRHTIRPSLSFSFRPNFNDPFWGRTRTLRTETDSVVQRYDILNGSRAGGSTAQRNVSFSLDNEFETKRVRTDTTGDEQVDRLKLLDFDANTSYNFAADRFPLSDIRTRARTDLFDRFDFTLGMTFSPYALEPQGTPDENGEQDFDRVDRFMASDTPWKPVRLTRFDLSVRGSFRADQQGQRNPVSEPRANLSDAQNAGRLSPYEGSTIADRRNPYAAYPNTPTGYVDFSVPWSLSFSFNYSFNKPAKEITRRNAIVNANFDFNVTPKWKVSGNTGYDFVQGELSTTRISINRDLCCWNLSFSWVPFGEFQSYSFNLSVKSGKLSQLLRLQLPREGDDSRLGGIGRQIGQTVSSGVSGGRRGF
jgi:hypothetical protein